MKWGRQGIAVGGERRLRRAVKARIRAAYQPELDACGSETQRTAIEQRMELEVEKEMKRLASPHSVWGAP